MLGPIRNVIRYGRRALSQAQPPRFSPPYGVERILFGDSIFIRVSHNDKNKTSIKDSLSQRYGQDKTYVFAYSALALPHYLLYSICATSRIDSPVDIVVPINYRSFSMQWEFNPDWQYRKTLCSLLKKAEIDSFTDLELLQNSNYKSAKGEYFYYGNKENEFFLRSIADKAISTELFLERRRKIFAFNYLFDESVLKRSKRFFALDALISFASYRKLNLLLYIPPINHEAIEFLFSERALDVVKNNIDYIKEYCFERGVAVNDFSLTANRFGFFNEFEATEHLNERGRNLLLENLSGVIAK